MSFFTTYDADSALRAQTAAGELAVDVSAARLGSFLTPTLVAVTNPLALSLLPPNVTLRSFAGDVRLAGATTYRYDNPTKGPRGESLSTDVARVGADDASKVVVAISSTKAKLFAMVAASGETLAIMAFARDLAMTLGDKVYTDSSAALGFSQRSGIGKVRYFDRQANRIRIWVRFGRRY